MSEDIKVHIKLPLPMDVAASLTRGIGTMYPNTTMDTDSGKELILVVHGKDRDAGAKTKDLEHDPADPDGEGEVTGFDDGTMKFHPPETQEEAMADLARIAKAMIDSSPGAENYVEMKVVDRDTGKQYVIITARSDKQTPHELRQRADNKLSAIAALLAMPGALSKKQIKKILEEK